MPLIRNDKTSSGAIIGLWLITETQDELLDACRGYADIEIAVDAFTSARRRLEYLATRALLATLLDEIKEIGYHSSGKPYLKDGSFFISISHTRGIASVILHESNEVAIDIEQMSEKPHRLSQRFLSGAEVVVDSAEYSLLCWSAKETMFKLLGVDDVDFREHLHIQPFSPQPCGEIIAKETKTSDKLDFVISYELTGEWALTYCNRI